jgi:hypothetical protein
MRGIPLYTCNEYTSADLHDFLVPAAVELAPGQCHFSDLHVWPAQAAGGGIGLLIVYQKYTYEVRWARVACCS